MSVFIAVDDVGPRSETGILRNRLRSYRGVYSPTVGALAESGFDVLPTFVRPHYSVLLSGPDEAPALMAALGELRPNPYAVDRGESR